jgi:hypothetical protein
MTLLYNFNGHDFLMILAIALLVAFAALALRVK